MAGLTRPDSLADNQTRLAPYEQLSPATKQQMAEARAAQIAAAEEQAAKFRMQDTLYNVLSAPGRLVAGAYGLKNTGPQDRHTPLRQKAQALRDWKPDPYTLYADDNAVHTIDPDAPLFAPRGLPKPK